MSEAAGPPPRSDPSTSGDPPSWSSAQVRQLLLGRSGPYGDARSAVDALDDVDALVLELGVDDVVALASALVALVTDADAVVATGAVLALDVVRRRQAPSAEPLADLVVPMIHLVLTPGTALDRAPAGFAAASQPTLRAELAVIAARSASPEAIAAVTTLVERASAIGVPRVDLVAALAEQLPALVVASARAWVGPQDSAVVARIAEHHRRVAVAMAARPWHASAIAAIQTAARWQRWHEAQLDAVLRVMRDEAPELTAPRGVGDVDLDGRWWIVAERSWDWTLWRCDDGRTVLEQVEGTVGVWTSVRDVPEEAAVAILDATIAGVELTGRQIATSLPPEP
jgi:hypothetical protein